MENMIINTILEAAFWFTVLTGVPFVAYYIQSHR